MLFALEGRGFEVLTFDLPRTTLIELAVYEQCFSLSACGARQITEEWGELNPNWHLEAFGAFYTPFWAGYA